MSDAVVGLELSVEATKLLHFADGITRNGSIASATSQYRNIGLPSMSRTLGR
jgi:hypothetical protein